MQMISVESSNLVSVGYDDVSKVLQIQFRSGLYEYYDVPYPVYRELLSAPSKGEYHAVFIKNAYRYRRLG